MSELSELYISMTLKSLALSLIAIFLPVYLYQEGYSITQIGLYYAFYFAIRTILDLVAGSLTARFGPKHMLSYSYVLLIVFLGMLLTLPTYNWPLFLLATANASFNSLFFIAYHVDFSKVHSVKSGGSELSTMNILVRAAAAIGPFVGGLIATYFSINVTIMLALLLVLFAIWPLMLTAEPVKQQRKLDLNQFSFRRYRRNIISYIFEGISRQVGLVIWPLFISVFIFVDGVYAKVGFVTSLSIAASLVVTRLYGKLIDKKAGKTLLNTSAWAISGLHLVRPHIGTLGGVASVNLVSEFAETGIILPFTKGFYDEADSSNYRIAYITMMESIVSIMRAVFWLVLIIIAINFGDKTALLASFYIASASALVIMTQKFKALQ